MCHTGADIVLHQQVVVKHLVKAWAIDGVTEPEFDVLESDELDPQAPVEQVVAVSCRRCRWSYTGPAPLARLVRL
jgi:hypothetical protein